MIHLVGEGNTKINTTFDEENMDWSPQTNYHRAYCETLDTPNLACVIGTRR